MPSSRQIADSLGLVAHIVLVVVTFTSVDELTDSLRLLAAMSIITGLFHILYVGLYNSKTEWLAPFTVTERNRNKLKWVEYAITATIASVAILLSGDADSRPPWSVVVFIITVAITEQVTGFSWDSIETFGAGPETEAQAALLAGGARSNPDADSARRAFYTTFLCQIAEFLVLYEYGSKGLVAYVFYVIGWTLFGIWAWLREPWYARLVGTSIGTDPDRLEAYETGYSILSTFAKVSVFAATIAASV